MSAARFRDQAALCRRLADTLTVADEVQRLRTLADEYDAAALRVDTRRRARIFDARSSVT